jgi:hypothetical protein
VFDAWQNLSLDAANERSLDEITLVFEHNETRSRLSNYTAQLKARDRERIPPP